MSQIYLLNSGTLLSSVKPGVSEYSASLYNSTGAGTFDLLVSNKPKYVVALEPGTTGLIYIDTVRTQRAPGTTNVTTTTFASITVFYTCSRLGVVTISVGTPMYSTAGAPETPAAFPGRSNFVIYAGVNSSGTNPPYLRLQVVGNANVSNYVSYIKVLTTLFDGV